ncbi:hypothetical protein CB1_002263005 [Camelus ferus]|nr:hypothetical protein CB1_002263005 [Camelus ferus]
MDSGTGLAREQVHWACRLGDQVVRKPPEDPLGHWLSSVSTPRYVVCAVNQVPTELKISCPYLNIDGGHGCDIGCGPCHLQTMHKDDTCASCYGDHDDLPQSRHIDFARFGFFIKSAVIGPLSPVSFYACLCIDQCSPRGPAMSFARARKRVSHTYRLSLTVSPTKPTDAPS